MSTYNIYFHEKKQEKYLSAYPFYIKQGPTPPAPEVIKLFSCSTRLRMKFILQINLKLLTTANSFSINIAEYEIFSANKYENANNSWNFHIY